MGMDAKTYLILFLVLRFAACESKQFQEEPRSLREMRREIHYLSKRHMLPRETERKRRTTTQRTKESRKKPSGHLRPLKEDDMENDEVVSVAIGPPVTRPKYEKSWKPRQASNSTASATNFVKDILVQLGREFLTHKVSDDFVFGQYVGNAMKNITIDTKIKMQHDILELIMKYQKINNGEMPQKQTRDEQKPQMEVIADFKDKDKKFSGNETEEGWPDFSNLAKIVG